MHNDPSAVYDLSGRKVNGSRLMVNDSGATVNSPLRGAGGPSTVKLPSGVYIVNGKKLFVK